MSTSSSSVDFLVKLVTIWLILVVVPRNGGLVEAYYCDHDYCSTEQFCCGENICCDYVNSTIWHFVCLLISVIVFGFVLWGFFQLILAIISANLLHHNSRIGSEDIGPNDGELRNHSTDEDDYDEGDIEKNPMSGDLGTANSAANSRSASSSSPFGKTTTTKLWTYYRPYYLVKRLIGAFNSALFHRGGRVVKIRLPNSHHHSSNSSSSSILINNHHHHNSSSLNLKDNGTTNIVRQ